jgi:hypothetical protein
MTRLRRLLVSTTVTAGLILSAVAATALLGVALDRVPVRLAALTLSGATLAGCVLGAAQVLLGYVSVREAGRQEQARHSRVSDGIDEVHLALTRLESQQSRIESEARALDEDLRRMSAQVRALGRTWDDTSGVLDPDTEVDTSPRAPRPARRLPLRARLAVDLGCLLLAVAGTVAVGAASGPRQAVAVAGLGLLVWYAMHGVSGLRRAPRQPLTWWLAVGAAVAIPVAATVVLAA